MNDFLSSPNLHISKGQDHFVPTNIPSEFDIIIFVVQKSRSILF